MTRVRLWLANLISGGEVARLRMRVDGLLQEVSDGIEEVEDLSQDIDRAMKACTEYEVDAFNRGQALRSIAAMETQKANATVKRMAKRAREALE